MALTKITSNVVKDDAVTSAKIVDGGIATADIAANAVTSAKIAQNSILTKHIDDGQVTTDQLGADAVTSAKIADDAISEEHLDVTVITGLSEVTAATGDLLMVADISDSNNLKKIPVSSILAGTLTNAAQTNITSLGTLSALNVVGNVTQGNGDYIYNGGGNFDIKHTTASQNIVFSTTPSGGSTTEVIRITHDGKLAKTSGNLTLDVAADIKLDADSSNIYLADGGTDIGLLSVNNEDLNIRNLRSDKDIYFQGSDSGTTFTALSLDMSGAGAATFNSTIATGGGGASGKIAIAGNTATNEATHITFTNVQGAKVFAIGGGQSGVTNNGFVIRNVTDNTFPLVISDAGVVEVGTLTSGLTGNVIINSEGGNPPALQVKSRTNRARINVQDNDTSGYIIAEGSVFSFGFADAVSANNININTSHNVGIGTTTPISHLHVNKDTTGHNTDGITLGKVEANGWIDTNEEMGRLGWAASYGSSYTPAIGAYISAKADANWNGNEAPTRLGFFTAPENSLTPVERLRIDKDGNVAIGDDSPDNKLTIRAASTIGTVKGHIMLTGDGATNGEGPQIVFSESGVNSNFAGAYIGHARTGSNSIGDLIFGTRATSGDANTVPTERMRIDSSGDVGIGTTNPSSKLHIESGNAHNKLSVTSTASGGTGYDAVIDLLGSASNSEVALNMGINGDADREQIKTYQSTMMFKTNNTERMRITSVGAIEASTTGAKCLQLNSTHSNGPYLSFQESGSTKFYIGKRSAVGGTSGTGYDFYAVGNYDIAFYTNAARRWSINTSGHFTPAQQHTYDIGGVNAEVRNIYAQGISFASNANASGMSSELLDDYEEGTYTATISCASGSISLNTSFDELRYTKIGKLVHVQGRLACNGVSNPTGATNLNLPFTSINDLNKSGMADNVITGYFNGSAVTNGIYTVYGNIDEGSSNCRLFIMIIPATNNLGDNHMASGSDLYVNFTYTAA